MKTSPNFWSPCCETMIVVNNKKRLVKAMLISQAPGTVITEAIGTDGEGKFVVTHLMTGTAVTNASTDIAGLMTRARRAYKAMTPEQRKIWRTEANPKIVKANVPYSAIAALKS